MAAFGTRSIVLPSQENVPKGKNQSRTQIQYQPKRPVLKEVGNRVVAQNVIKEQSKELNKPEKKLLQPVPPAVLPGAKPRPAIQVKETKACRLRTQHSRLSISKVTEKKNANPPLPPPPPPKQEIVTKPQVHIKTVNTKCSEHLTKCSQITNALDEKSTVPELQESVKVSSTTDTCVEKKAELENAKDVCEQKVAKALPSAFSSTLLNCAYVIDIDKDDENDPFTLGMYAKDMYKYLREMEVKFPISPDYLKDSRLNGKMRATLIDWLVDIQQEFEMNPETLFLTVAVIDRYLQKNPTTNRNKLQLVGITAMFIASKYEEMILPDVNELVYVSDNAYCKREILQMEITMVKALDCSFGRPLPIHFLRRYSKADMVAPVVHVMAKYIMEMGILEYELCHIPPSLLAAAALYISLWLLKRKKGVWSNSLVQYSSYVAADVVPVVKKLCSVLINADASKFQAIPRKFSRPKNMQVSVLPVLKNLPDLVGQIYSQ